jgi:gas vesicle protein
MTMSQDEKGLSATTAIISFFAGAAIGAGLALLYAPKSGREMRESIADLADDAVDKIKEYAKEAQDRIKTTLEEGKENLMEKKSILSSAIEAGREAMQKEKERRH